MYTDLGRPGDTFAVAGDRLLGAVLYKLYPVTFGNDNKSYQNKSHNEITAKLVQKWHNFRG